MDHYERVSTSPRQVTWVRVKIRIYIERALMASRKVIVPEDELDKLVQACAEAVELLTMGRFVYMMEFEFVDEPDPAQRITRVGTDPRGMDNPIAIDLSKGKHGAN
jgi:hypothetical protein